MQESKSIIKRVDHIVLKIDGPAYEQLFRLFSELFRLPIAWMTGSYPPFISSGIFAGNVNLNLLQLKQDTTNRATKAYLAGIAMEAYNLEECLQELKQRNIPYLAPILFAYPDENGRSVPHWTTVTLGNLLGNNQWLNTFSFISKALPSQLWQRASSTATTNLDPRTLSLLERSISNGTIFLRAYNSERYSIAEDRYANREVLRARNGGPLGLEEVKEIVLGVTDFPLTNTSWHNLFVPEPAVQPGLWQIGDGPAIRLIPYEQNTLLRMVWRVSSLERAREFLSTQQMLGRVLDQSITLTPEKVFGLDIRLIS